MIFTTGSSIQDYKPLRAAVTICATMVDPTFHFYILTPVTLKNSSNQRWISQLVRIRQMHQRYKFGKRRSINCRNNAHVSIFYDDLKRNKLGQGDLFCAEW